MTTGKCERREDVDKCEHFYETNREILKGIVNVVKFVFEKLSLNNFVDIFLLFLGLTLYVSLVFLLSVAAIFGDKWQETTNLFFAPQTRVQGFCGVFVSVLYFWTLTAIFVGGPKYFAGPSQCVKKTVARSEWSKRNKSQERC